jgi:hypothetical protein
VTAAPRIPKEAEIVSITSFGNGQRRGSGLWARASIQWDKGDPDEGAEVGFCPPETFPEYRLRHDIDQMFDEYQRGERECFALTPTRPQEAVSPPPAPIAPATPAHPPEAQPTKPAPRAVRQDPAPKHPARNPSRPPKTTADVAAEERRQETIKTMIVLMKKKRLDPAAIRAAELYYDGITGDAAGAHMVDMQGKPKRMRRQGWHAALTRFALATGNPDLFKRGTFRDQARTDNKEKEQQGAEDIYDAVDGQWTSSGRILP